MRGFLSLVSLLLVLAVVAWLAKGSLTSLTPGTSQPGVATGAATGTPKQQVQAYERELKGALEAAGQARASEAAN